MKKERLFDCCGAYHVYGFPSSPRSPTYVNAYDGHGIPRGTVRIPSAIWVLEQFSSGRTNHNIPIPGHPGRYLSNHAPGITTCVLAGYQNTSWQRELRRLGWVETVNNVRNANSENTLHFWVKIDRDRAGNRPDRRGGQYTWADTGEPYGGNPRLKADGTPYRARRRPGGPLVELVAQSSSPPFPLKVN